MHLRNDGHTQVTMDNHFFIFKKKLIFLLLFV